MSGTQDPLKPATKPALKAETGWADSNTPAETPVPSVNRSWPEIRRRLISAAFEIQGERSSERTFFNPPHPFTFTYLGAGTNKHAARINDTPWVLLCGNPVAGAELTKTSFKDEVDTLIALGAQGVPVPRPFDSNVSRDSLLFEIKVFFDGHEKMVPAFLEEYLPVSESRFAEMPKEPDRRLNFARAVILADASLPRTIWKTVDDINAIGKEMDRNPWNDFQLMYDRQTGRVIVFDPMPFPKDDTSPQQARATNLAVLKQWLDDIDDTTQQAVKR